MTTRSQRNHAKDKLRAAHAAASQAACSVGGCETPTSGRVDMTVTSLPTLFGSSVQVGLCWEHYLEWVEWPGSGSDAVDQAATLWLTLHCPERWWTDDEWSEAFDKARAGFPDYNEPL